MIEYSFSRLINSLEDFFPSIFPLNKNQKNVFFKRVMNFERVSVFQNSLDLRPCKDIRGIFFSPAPIELNNLIKQKIVKKFMDNKIVLTLFIVSHNISQEFPKLLPKT